MRSRLLLLGALFAAAAVGVAGGFHEQLDREGLRGLVEGSQGWAPAVFLALFGLLQPLGVPGVVFIGVAVVLWPPWLAFVLVWLGALASGCVGFVFARYLARDWAARHMPARFRSLDARLAERGLLAVVVARVVLYLATPAHWAFGLSSVSFRTMFAGSALGFLPPSALWTFAGSRLADGLAAGDPRHWAALAGLVCAALGGVYLLRRRLMAREAAPATATSRADPGAPL